MSAGTRVWRVLCEYVPLLPVKPTAARLIACSGLPVDVRGLISRVVRRTRLWPHERQDVARELISHFAAATESGRSAGDAISDFGDWRRAARLIRRAKVRQRNWFWVVRHRLYQVVGTALIILLAASGFAMSRAAILRPSPTYDYLADLDREARSIPIEDRAWPLYREACFSLGNNGVLRDEQGERVDLLTVAPGDPEWDAARDLVAGNETALHLARLAAERPRMGAVLAETWHDSELKVVLGITENTPNRSSAHQAPIRFIVMPQLPLMRTLTGLFAIEARIAVSEARSPADSLIALIRISRHMADSPILIAQLGGVNALCRTMTMIRSVLDRHASLLTDEDLAALGHALSAYGAGGHGCGIRIDLSAERVEFLDWLQHIYSDNGKGQGIATSAGFRNVLAKRWETEMSGLGAAFRAASQTSRRSMLEEYDRIFSVAQSAMNQPLWKHDPRPAQDEKQLREEMSPLRQIRYGIAHGSIGFSSGLYYYAELVSQHRDALFAVLALELHYRRTGAYPSTLNDLVPHYLPEVPIDRFDGQPLRYALRDGRPLLYSIGSDRVDNGGVLPPAAPDAVTPEQRNGVAAKWRSDRELDEARLNPGAFERLSGDWILWPPARD